MAIPELNSIKATVARSLLAVGGTASQLVAVYDALDALHAQKVDTLPRQIIALSELITYDCTGESDDWTDFVAMPNFRNAGSLEPHHLVDCSPNVHSNTLHATKKMPPAPCHAPPATPDVPTLASDDSTLDEDITEKCMRNATVVFTGVDLNSIRNDVLADMSSLLGADMSVLVNSMSEKCSEYDIFSDAGDVAPVSTVSTGIDDDWQKVVLIQAVFRGHRARRQTNLLRILRNGMNDVREGIRRDLQDLSLCIASACSDG